MEKFPIEKVLFTSAVLNGTDGNVSIEISLAPFELSLDGYSENVDTHICLESIRIPANPLELEGKQFDFPVNPSPGYIDGSIYFFAAHNPVDVTSIRFGSIESGKMPLTLETVWVLEFEGTGYQNIGKTVAANIEL
jgi:hypothetical protein